MQAPTVSILIPTFNRAHYVGDAVRSAVRQTFTDTEIIVVDDGSTDSTVEIVNAIADPRVRIVSHDHNRGIPETRNTALAAATGRYIAWLDSDDTSRPTRIREQVDFLDRNPAIAMVGSAAGKMNVDGTARKGIRMPPLNPEMIAAWLLFRSAFQQSSIMGRSAISKEYRYDPRYKVCEDVDMFVRIQRQHALANIPKVLIDRRLHPGQTVRQYREDILANRRELIIPTLHGLGIDASVEDLRQHVLLGLADLHDIDVDQNFLAWAHAWLGRLLEANAKTRMLDQDALATASDYFWVLACRAMVPKLGLAKSARAVLRRMPTSLVGSNVRTWLKQSWRSYAFG